MIGSPRARLLAIALAVGATGCHDAPARKLPGATIAPRTTTSARATRACGVDISYGTGTTPDVRYTYTYDELGRMIHATGRFTDLGPDDVIDYTYDHLDHPTHSFESRGPGYDRAEEVEDYDSLGDLVSYTLAQSGPGYADTSHYTYLDLTPSGQPIHEIVGETGQLDARYTLAYDATDRIIAAILDGGQTTTYTYDDDVARSLTIDTGDGAFHGLILYDDLSRELSETWGGTDPQAQARETAYDWDGDLLASITFRQGTPLETVEVETARYDCVP